MRKDRSFERAFFKAIGIMIAVIAIFGSIIYALMCWVDTEP